MFHVILLLYSLVSCCFINFIDICFILLPNLFAIQFTRGKCHSVISCILTGVFFILLIYITFLLCNTPVYVNVCAYTRSSALIRYVCTFIWIDVLHTCLCNCTLLCEYVYDGCVRGCVFLCAYFYVYICVNSNMYKHMHMHLLNMLIACLLYPCF